MWWSQGSICRAMGRYLLACVLLVLQSDLAHALEPLLCQSTVCTINPTMNTITLEKPFCFYTSSSPVTVALYVVRNSAINMSLALTNTYQTTNGGTKAPYVADTFANPDCNWELNPADVDKYVYRVGSNFDCFNATFCNGPLATNTIYRFMYVFYDTSKAIVFKSDWSAPITTKEGKDAASIDTWPGRRSGGMIVLTSILSVLMFFVLAGLVATAITSFMAPTKELEPTRHESRSTHVPQKAEGGANPLP